LDNDLINLKKNIFFEEINDLMKIEEKEKYQKKEKELVNKLKKLDETQLKKFVKELNIYNPENSDKENNKNKYNFINIETINMLLEKENSEDLKDCYYFKSKDEYFIIFPELKKLYRIDYDKEKDNFKLGEYPPDNKEQKKINFDNFSKNIKDLEKNDNDIKNKIKSKFENACSMENYYLIPFKWIQEFKKQFKAPKKKEKENISKYLLTLENLQPENIKEKINYKNETPIDFEIINKSLFNSILENLNSLKGDPKLYSEYIYDISFGAGLIFIHDLQNNDIFIYSREEEEKYKLEYIITPENNDCNLKDLLKDCNDFKSFLNKYDLKLSTKEIQKIKEKVKIRKRKYENIIIAEFRCLNAINKEEEEEEEEKEDEEKKIEKPVHCLGLENIGATCYMNATIQCLCHVSKFKDFFCNNPLINSITQNRYCPLTLSFCSLINNLWKFPKDNNNKDYYTPTDFKNIISEMNPLFQGIQANDSKDLVLFIYENIHKEINTIPYNFNQYNLYNCNNDFELMNFRNNYYSVNSSILVDVFYFEQQTCLQCLNCQSLKISYCMTNMIIFPLEQVRQYVFQISKGQKNDVNLDLCFNQNQVGETLTGDNRIYCNTCRCISDAIMVNHIYTSPEVLTIILNRGKGLEFDVNFNLDHYINLDNYVIDKTSGKNNLYELIGILCHFGPSGMSGHFIAFCKSPEDHNWYCYNDASVEKCKGDPEIKNHGNIEGIPYVLYYQRVETKDEQKNNFVKEHMKNYIQNNQNMININNNFNMNSNNNINMNSNNNFNNNINDNIQINNFIDNNKNKINIKSNKNNIYLKFKYEDNEYDLEIKKKSTIEDVIIELNKKYSIPKNVMVLSEKNNMVPYNIKAKINNTNLSDNDVLIIIDL